jgi:hypothetical protein
MRPGMVARLTQGRPAAGDGRAVPALSRSAPPFANMNVMTDEKPDTPDNLPAPDEAAENPLHK